MAYYLGIDGGGTKTRCLLGDETAVLATAMTGGSNLVRLGETATREALHSAIRQVCTIARISPDQIHAICIGAAGAARPEIDAKIRSIVSPLFPGTPPSNIEVAGDTVIALEAAFGARRGVIAIAGTGSIVYGRDAAGRTARAGGWGFAISDEGSGHWIGRHAIAAIVNACDQGSETVLTRMVLQAWKLTTIDDLVQQANATPSPDFPRLFPIVLGAAESDPIARNLLHQAGTSLAGLAATVVRRLDPGPPRGALPAATLSVAMTGSVFRQSSVVREVFYNSLETSFPGIDVRQDLIDPIE